MTTNHQILIRYILIALMMFYLGKVEDLFAAPKRRLGKKPTRREWNEGYVRKMSASAGKSCRRTAAQLIDRLTPRLEQQLSQGRYQAVLLVVFSDYANVTAEQEKEFQLKAWRSRDLADGGELTIQSAASIHTENTKALRSVYFKIKIQATNANRLRSVLQSDKIIWAGTYDEESNMPNPAAQR